MHQLRIQGKTEESSFCEELQQVFDHLPMDHIKIMLREFNDILGSEHLYKTTIGNDTWHENSGANGVRVVNYATSKNLVVKSTKLQHQNSHKHTWTCPDEKTHNDVDHKLINRR